MERFADLVDMAQAHVEQETSMRIERIRQEAQKGIGRPNCIDCGTAIPADRRRHVPSAVRCVPCQDQLETRG
jgi:phage/conjugal plasmid C-4 type zinc finger TraR family protein